MLRFVSTVTLSSVSTLFLLFIAIASAEPGSPVDDGGEQAQVRPEDAALAPQIPQEILDAITAREATAPEHLAINEHEVEAMKRGELVAKPLAPPEHPAAPMAVELGAQIEALEHAMKGLHARYVEALEAGDSAALAELDRQINVLHRDSEESLLRTQLRFALEAERADQVREIQSALRVIELQKNANDVPAPLKPLPPALRARAEEAGR